MTSTFSLRLAPDLIESVEYRAAALGYPSRNAYLIGLIRADAIRPADHQKAQQIARLGDNARDEIDAGILREAKLGPAPIPGENIIAFPMMLARA